MRGAIEVTRACRKAEEELVRLEQEFLKADSDKESLRDDYKTLLGSLIVLKWILGREIDPTIYPAYSQILTR